MHSLFGSFPNRAPIDTNVDFMKLVNTGAAFAVPAVMIVSPLEIAHARTVA